jgi:putative RecB family exonuclease
VALLGPLSYSSVRTYLECPLRWKYLYVDRLPEAPRGYFSFGRTVHAVLEELVRPLVVPLPRVVGAGTTQRTLDEFRAAAPSEPRAPMGREELLRAYARLWVGDGYTSPEEEARYRALGQELLLRYYDGFVRAPPVPVAVEEHLEARWDGIPVHGYIDRIDRTASGGLEILDYKTSRGLSVIDAATSDQLSFYQVLVEKNYPAPVESLALFDLRGGSALRVGKRSTEAIRALAENVGRTADGIRAEAFEPLPGRHCQRCEFRPRCPEWAPVPLEEREKLGGLVDRFVHLRDEEARVERELRRVAEELHREAERLGVHRIPGSSGTALRRREENWSFAPEDVRELVTAPELKDRVSATDAAAVERLVRDPTVDPELRRRLAERAGRRVRWFWELDREPEGPMSRTGPGNG